MEMSDRRTAYPCLLNAFLLRSGLYPGSWNVYSNASVPDAKGELVTFLLEKMVGR